eukprot:192378-Rhodomonas_salina.1
MSGAARCGMRDAGCGMRDAGCVAREHGGQSLRGKYAELDQKYANLLNELEQLRAKYATLVGAAHALFNVVEPQANQMGI